MKQLIIIVSTALLLVSCNTKNTEIMNTTRIFPKGELATENFTGDTWVKILTFDAENFDAMSYDVTFAPKSRTYWHSHPGGQILYCTSGNGCYQEKGGALQHLKAGNVVEIKPNIIHWHGAAPDSEFTHLGISTQLSKGPADWHGEVTDEDYNGALNNK